MKTLVFACLWLGWMGTGFAQESITLRTIDEKALQAITASANEVGVPMMPGSRLFKNVGVPSPVPAAPSRPPESRLDHLLKAAAHLEAAGEPDQAHRVRQLAAQEREALLARLKALQAEVDRLQHLLGNIPQVLVEVKMMELDRKKLRATGFDFARLGPDGKSVAGVGGIGQADKLVDFKVVDENDPLIQLLGSLRKDGLMKVLSAPKLVTVSGQRALFQVGGQVPVMTPKDDGSQQIEYQNYGTRMDLVATVMEDQTIRLEIHPRISEIIEAQDPTTAPPGPLAMRVREIDTAVEMQSGQTLVIAGLAQRRDAGRPAEKDNADQPQEAGSDAEVDQNGEEPQLIILATPRIMRPPVASRPHPSY